MKHLLNSSLILLALLGVVGCTTTTTVQVQRVLVNTAQLRDDSPYGRKVLVAVQALTQVRQQELQIQQKYQANYTRHSTNAAALMAKSTDAPRKQQLQGLLQERKQLLEDLQNHIGLIQTNIQVLTNFFAVDDAMGLAPRIDWEIMKTLLLMDQEKQWLAENFCSRLSEITKQSTALRQTMSASAGLQQAQLEQQEQQSINSVTNEVESTRLQLTSAITVTGSQGFGGFVTLGVAEIDPSDPEYRQILSWHPVALSPDSFSMATASITGDANVIIVQEAPGQFRTYQISNDPTTLLKNISMVVSKATAAAAKYLSGGIAP